MNTALIETSSQATAAVETGEQYSLARILGIWALTSVPGALLYWLGLPVLDQYTEISVGNLVLIVIGLPYIWHLILAYWILKREMVAMSWNAVKDRLWLRTTSDPGTGKKNNALWLWLIPALVVYGFGSASPTFQSIDNWWARIVPITEPAQYSMDILFENPDTLVGNWGFVLIFLLVSILNMSEEIIIRGILLPKMNGVFGRADWIANGALFAFYHLDRPWNWPSYMVYSTLSLALPARMFRSIWFSIVVHFSQTIFFLFLILGLVLGLA